VPAAVEDAVLRCLEKRVDDRFASARDMRKQLEAALRDADVGLLETGKLARDALGLNLPSAELPTTGPGDASRRARPVAPVAPVAPVDDPRRGRGRNRLPWLAFAVIAAVGSATAVVLIRHRQPSFRSTVEIAGVALTKGATAGKLVVETDGSVEPAELAQLYASTLGALRSYARAEHLDKLDAVEPVDVLLAVPAAALCEPTAYLDHQPPKDCAEAASATAIGARGTHRLMVVSDRARLSSALRGGVAQAACEFSPVEDNKLVRRICDVTGRFASAAN
jgi:hypothetical protein